MAVPLRNRSDLKAAGRNMAIQAVDAIAGHFAKLSQAELDDPSRIDAVTERLLDSAASVGREYLEAGFPPAWVRGFLSAFHRTATERLAAYVQAVRPAANDA